MVTHPNHLHARANLWSLHTALQHLHTAEIAADQAAAADDDYGTLQAWRPGGGVHDGRDHGDVLLDAVIRHHSGRLNPYADRQRRTLDTISWVARVALRGLYLADMPPLDQLRVQLPNMNPLTAANLSRWMVDEDTAVRRLLREPDDHRLLPGATCPACDTAGSLALRTSGPAEDRVVVCMQLCSCTGTRCPCAATVRAAGAAHIWPMADLRIALAK